ncbi:MAG TPA: hypothetical protein QF353_06970 [Gammaproteobacteria bacterium]|nr:hypothetical protein [Gammaproteobacteria bacterium]
MTEIEDSGSSEVNISDVYKMSKLTPEDIAYLKSTRWGYLVFEDLPSSSEDPKGPYADPQQDVFKEKAYVSMDSGGRMIYTPEGEFPSMIQIAVTGDPEGSDQETTHKSRGHYIAVVKEAFVIAMKQGWRGIHILEGTEKCLRLAWMLAKIQNVPCPNFEVFPKDEHVLSLNQKSLAKELSEVLVSKKGPKPTVTTGSSGENVDADG